MAAPAVEAFGHYLRQLRERRGLSLDDVASLSSTFPDPVGKGYLSRCENGRLKIAFSKTIALSRIYEVPPEVLAERMRLDLEVDRIGGPDTSGSDLKTLFRASLSSSRSGRYWNAYSQVRDALMIRCSDIVIDHVSTPAEQSAACQIMLASFCSRLGAANVAFYELTQLDPDGLGPYYRAVLHDRLQVQHRRRGFSDLAASDGDAALEMAKREGFPELLPPFLENRALTYMAVGDHASAIQCHQDAIAHYSSDYPSSDRIQAFMRLGETYIAASRPAPARRILEVARRDAKTEGLSRTEAQCVCLLGDIAWNAGQAPGARSLWKEAASLLRGYHDARMRFAIDVRLFRLALHVGDGPSSRALKRRLSRTLPGVPVDMPEVTEFAALLRSDESVAESKR